MYVNRMSVLEMIPDKELTSRLQVTRQEAEALCQELPPIPIKEKDKAFIALLAEQALKTALRRHAGVLKEYFGPSGRKVAAMGKDLTAVRYFIGTGGALTRLPNRIQIIQTALEEEKRMELLPDSNIEIYIDEDYIIASLGVMSLEYPEAAAKLARKSLRLAQRRDKE